MLFHKSHPTPWPLFFFGLLAVGVMAAMGALLYVLLSRGQETRVAEMISEQAAMTQEHLRTSYETTLTTLRTRLNGSGLHSISLAEQTFLSIRVPKEWLDPHIEAVLALERVKREASMDGAIVEQAVTQIVETLMQKTRKTIL